ncbi:MAG: VPLPA-CTERM sorting domain-containing protein [Methylococcales bacterium]
MKNTLLASAILAALSISGAATAAPIADGTITFNNNAVATPTGGAFTQGTGVFVGGTFIATGVALNADFEAGAEFRMVGPDGLVGGGGQKDIVTTTIDWTTGFDGFVIASTGDITPGCAGVAGCLGAVQGGFNNADFFGSPFGFALDPMIPVTADVVLVEGGLFSVGAASAQAQWGGTLFPLGMQDAANEVCSTGAESNCGFNMSGTISNVQADGSFDFVLRGEHLISPWEDTAGGTGAASGFAGWTAQFQIAGSFAAAPSIIPVPAAVWLFGSGLIGLAGVARRRKTA